MKVTKDTLTVSELEHWYGQKGQTVQLKDADPNELQLRAVASIRQDEAVASS